MRIHTRALTCLVIGAIASLVAWPILARAFIQQPGPTIRFGMVGLALGQTARLNAVNLLPPDPVVPPEPCRVLLRFLDSTGQTFLNPDGTESVREVSLIPGHAAFLDMRADQVSMRTRRVQLRAALEYPPEPCREVVATLEIFDTLTGRTMVLYVPPDPVMPAGGEVAN